MNIEDLELGKAYECVLSGQTVLLIMAQTAPTVEGEEIEYKRSGKVSVIVEGIQKYSLIELHDGQLKEIN